MKKLFNYVKLEIEDVENILINIGELASKSKALRVSNELESFLLKEEGIQSINSIDIRDIFNNNIAILSFDPNNFSKRIYNKVEKLLDKLKFKKQLTKRDLLKLYRFATYISTPIIQTNKIEYDFNRKPDKIVIF